MRIIACLIVLVSLILGTAVPVIAAAAPPLIYYAGPPGAMKTALDLTTRDITKKWTMPINNWAAILNQLVIRFKGRLSL
jgi:hypothetical protein